MVVDWDPGLVVSGHTSTVVIVEANGEVQGVNPGTQHVLADIQGLGNEAFITVIAPPSVSVASGRADNERRAQLIAAAALARRQALDARTRRHDEMRQRIIDAMRRTHKANLLSYYRRLLARIDARVVTRVQGTAAR
jgi:hypothetical protein